LKYDIQCLTSENEAAERDIASKVNQLRMEISDLEKNLSDTNQKIAAEQCFLLILNFYYADERLIYGKKQETRNAIARFFDRLEKMAKELYAHSIFLAVFLRLFGEDSLYNGLKQVELFDSLRMLGTKFRHRMVIATVHMNLVEIDELTEMIADADEQAVAMKGEYTKIKAELTEETNKLRLLENDFKKEEVSMEETASDAIQHTEKPADEAENIRDQDSANEIDKCKEVLGQIEKTKQPDRFLLDQGA
uniref:AAA_9 domain-containing protein n=1 Tax=Gongylonema pulchrum TaxID=637853 RepID=A0A183E9S6_9BILA